MPTTFRCREEVVGWPGWAPAPQATPAASRPPKAFSSHTRGQPDTWASTKRGPARLG